jgi:photosystem II oxygen-evolving enhancer protein 1
VQWCNLNVGVFTAFVEACGSIARTEIITEFAYNFMKYRAFIAALLGLCFCFLTACSAEPPKVKLSDVPFTYDEIRNTGFANQCPQISETSRGTIPIEKNKSYTIIDFCVQPTTFFVKEESTNKRQEAEYISAKALTRFTSSLEQITNDLVLGDDGSFTLKEQFGIDFQPITVQLPGGEQVPFFFTIKELVAQSQTGLDSLTTSTDFSGNYIVPSYRSAAFLDPKGRGEATGYDNAVALPSSGDTEDYQRANVKKTGVREGTMKLQVSKINSVTGEIAGIFESEQPSDTDLGAREALDVRVRGLFYGRVQPAA